MIIVLGCDWKFACVFVCVFDDGLIGETIEGMRDDAGVFCWKSLTGGTVGCTVCPDNGKDDGDGSEDDGRVKHFCIGGRYGNCGCE